MTNTTFQNNKISSIEIFQLLICLINILFILLYMILNQNLKNIIDEIPYTLLFVMPYVLFMPIEYFLLPRKTWIQWFCFIEIILMSLSTLIAFLSWGHKAGFAVLIVFSSTYLNYAICFLNSIIGVIFITTKTMVKKNDHKI